MPGLTEHLEILHAVGTDLMERAYKVRTDLAAADLGTMFLSEKVAKRIVEKFPTLQDTLKKSDPGYETFVNNAHTIVANLSPLFTVLLQLLEFRDNALVLLSEMSSQQAIAMYDMKLNELVLAGYYNLMLKYAKLHILLGILGSPQGRGRLGLSVYAQAFTVLNNGRAPPEYEALASYLEDYKFPVSKLQDDMIKVRLRVADTLLPLGMQIIRLSDTSSLRAEGVLSPLNEQKSTKPGEVAPPPVRARAAVPPPVARPRTARRTDNHTQPSRKRALALVRGASAAAAARACHDSARPLPSPQPPPLSTPRAIAWRVVACVALRRSTLCSRCCPRPSSGWCTACCSIQMTSPRKALSLSSSLC
jgi:hypothetical protein